MDNDLSFWFGLLLVGLYFYIKYKIRKAREEKEHLEYIRSINLQPSKRSVSDEEMQKIDRLMQLDKKRQRIDNKYKNIVDNHNKLNDEINVKYSVARELTTFDSPEMEHVIELCKQDIAYAPAIIKYDNELQELYEDTDWYTPILFYDTFKRLAIIYEKRKEYDKAIDVCKQAINLGITKDGSQGGYHGRMARLIRKNGNLNKKLKDGKEDIISDDVDYTIH